MGVTGYQVKAYADLGRAADALQRIAVALERIAPPASAGGAAAREGDQPAQGAGRSSR